jgi:ABC-2 type transport system ATP-binding protein
MQRDGLQKNTEERSVSVPTGGSVNEIKNVLDKLSAAKIEIDAMSVHKPTLDDVFMHFTGHKVAKEEEKVEKKK